MFLCRPGGAIQLRDVTERDLRANHSGRCRAQAPPGSRIDTTDRVPMYEAAAPVRYAGTRLLLGGNRSVLSYTISPVLQGGEGIRLRLKLLVLRPNVLVEKAGGAHESLDEALCRLRLAQQKTLNGIATQHLQKPQLRLGLDAFSDQPQAQALGHRHNGGDDCGVLCTVRHAAHEGAIDLELLDPEALEIRKAGIARTEVVDGNPNAEVTQAQQRIRDRVMLIHQHALGNLEREELRRQPGSAQCTGDRVEQAALHELPRREINGDPQRRQPRLLPLYCLHTRVESMTQLPS